jgi:hypothetical protein
MHRAIGHRQTHDAAIPESENLSITGKRFAVIVKGNAIKQWLKTGIDCCKAGWHENPRLCSRLFLLMTAKGVHPRPPEKLLFFIAQLHRLEN